MNIVVALLFIVSTSAAVKVRSCDLEQACSKSELCFQVEVDGKLSPVCFAKGKEASWLSPTNLDATTQPCGPDSTLNCENGGICIRVIVGQYHTDICICPSVASGHQCENWGRQISVTVTNFTDSSTKVAVDKANTKAFLSNGGNGAGVSAAMFNIDGAFAAFDCDFNLPVSQASSIAYNDVTMDLEISLTSGQSIIFMKMPYDSGNLRWVHNLAGIDSITTDNYGNTFAVSIQYSGLHVNVYNSNGIEIEDIPLYGIYNYGASVVAICPASEFIVIATETTGYFYELQYVNNTVELIPATQHNFAEFRGGVKGIAIDAFGNVVVAGTKDYGVDNIGVYKYSTSTNNWFQHMVQIDSHYDNYFWITGFWVDQGLVYAVGSNDNERVKIYVVEYIDTNHTFTTIAPDQNTTPMHGNETKESTISMRPTTPMQDNYTTPMQGNYTTTPMQGNYTTAMQFNYTTPMQGNYTTPMQSNYTTPMEGNYTTPMQGNYTTPIRNVTMPMKSTTPMQGNYTTPIRNVTLPMESTTSMVTPGTTTQDPCLNNPCMNNGTCSYDSTVGVTCTCITMCHGIHCETCSKPNGCAGNMCNEGSTCQPVDATNYVCICAPGYSGTYCYTSDFHVLMDIVLT